MKFSYDVFTDLLVIESIDGRRATFNPQFIVDLFNTDGIVQITARSNGIPTFRYLPSIEIKPAELK